jgi:SAM-dependent methyltransferase
MSPLDRDTARAWIERWDYQQEQSLPDREDRFTALIDAVEAGVGREDPLVIDLGCGPGSLSVRLLERLPKATVIGVDADPVTLALGRSAYDGIRFEDLDLRAPGWSGQLGLDRNADAAVSTTALHWFLRGELEALYTELAARVLRPGGLLLDGDHFFADPDREPTLARLGKELREREDARRFPNGHRESWQGWWEAVAADPELAGYAAERQRRRVETGHHSGETMMLAAHVAALTLAGFSEIGTLWQRGDNRLLCAEAPPS